LGRWSGLIPQRLSNTTAHAKQHLGRELLYMYSQTSALHSTRCCVRLQRPPIQWPAHLQSPSIAGCLCVPRCRQHEWQDSTTTWPAAAVSCSRSQCSMRSNVDTAPMQMLQSLQFTMRANLQQHKAAALPVSHGSNINIKPQQHCLARRTNSKGAITPPQTACILHVGPHSDPPTHTDSLDRCQHVHVCLVAVLDCEALTRHVSRPTHHSATVHTRHSVIIHAAASNSDHATCCADLDTA
jgi:hypothetical protein